MIRNYSKVVIEVVTGYRCGNTNTVIGVYHDGELEYHWRIETSRHKTEDEFGIFAPLLI